MLGIIKSKLNDQQNGRNEKISNIMSQTFKLKSIQ